MVANIRFSVVRWLGLLSGRGKTSANNLISVLKEFYSFFVLDRFAVSLLLPDIVLEP